MAMINLDSLKEKWEGIYDDLLYLAAFYNILDHVHQAYTADKSDGALLQAIMAADYEIQYFGELSLDFDKKLMELVGKNIK